MMLTINLKLSVSINLINSINFEFITKRRRVIMENSIEQKTTIVIDPRKPEHERALQILYRIACRMKLKQLAGKNDEMKE